MDPILIGLLAGAGLGAVQGTEAQAKSEKQRKQEAQIAKWSPWTGMQAQRVQDPGMLAPMMQGGMTGAMIGSQFGKGAPGTPEVAGNTPGATMDMTNGQVPLNQQQSPWLNFRS